MIHWRKGSGMVSNIIFIYMMMPRDEMRNYTLRRTVKETCSLIHFALSI